jgi:serine/threonine protein kinase
VPADEGPVASEEARDWLLEPGDRLGPYRIDTCLGSGGMGQVYKASDLRLHRDVAIKILPPDVRADPHLRQRFEREARAIAALRHPHVCILHDVGQDGDLDFLVMEHLDGESLAERLTTGPLPLDQALRYAIEIADALAEVHRQGIIHRDLKPANIILTSAGAKVLDFGTAKQQSRIASRATCETSDSLTTAATIVGTLHYMAPEQLEGGKVDARADIFAFGALLYEMVTGRQAFRGSSYAAVVAAILEREPEPSGGTDAVAPPPLQRLILKLSAQASGRTLAGCRRNHRRSSVAFPRRGVVLADGSGVSRESTQEPRRGSRRSCSCVSVERCSGGLAWSRDLPAGKRWLRCGLDRLRRDDSHVDRQPSSAHAWRRVGNRSVVLARRQVRRLFGW